MAKITADPLLHPFIFELLFTEVLPSLVRAKFVIHKHLN